MNALRRSSAALSLAVLLAGCGAGTASDRAATDRSATPAAAAAGRCPGPGAPFDQTTSGHQPADAVPLGTGDEVVAVVGCTLSEKAYAGEGSWKVVTEARATTALQPLLTALRRPSETEAPAGCIQPLFVVPWFGLELADGRFVRPVVPLDSCEHPHGDVRAALDALPWQEVSTTRIELSRTQAEVDLEAQAAAAGCSYRFKDLLTMLAADLPRWVPATATPVPLPAGATVSVCRMNAGTVGADPVLTFVSGERLSGAAAGMLASALESSSAPATTCTESSAQQVVLQSDKGGYVVVELDGCHRVLSDQGRSTLTRASAELLAQLR